MQRACHGSPVTELNVLRVFTGPDGSNGNPLGVFLDGAAVPRPQRQGIAAELAFSETVFVDDPASGVVRIHTPTVELPLAGHPLVGTAWLLARAGRPVDTLRPPAGEVPTWTEGDLTWIRGRPEWAPDFALRLLDSPQAVESYPVPTDPDTVLEVWAWSDERAGTVRARVFPVALGVTEDEATGSAALRLASELGRPLTIRQGQGSELHAVPGTQPADQGTVAVGGRCVLDEVREFQV